MSSMELAMLLTLKDMASGGLGKIGGSVQKLSTQLMAIGQASKQMGQQMIGYMETPIKAFAAAENAATSLEVAMMGVGGVVSDQFGAVDKLARQMGNEFPASTAQMQDMMTVLIKNGIKAETVLGGLGRATGELGTLLEIPFDEAARLMAETSKATGVAAQDMTEFADLIQRFSHLGIETRDIGYAFAKAGMAMKSYGRQGMDAAKGTGILLAQIIEMGNTGETVGTNMKGVYNSLDQFQFGTSKSIQKTKSDLKALGIELDIFRVEKDKVTGEEIKVLPDERHLVAELEKLRKLTAEQQTKILNEIFGTGFSADIAKDIIKSGTEGYDAMARRAEEQAHLTERIQKKLSTLTNVWAAASGTFKNALAAIGGSLENELKALADWFNKLSVSIISFAETHPLLIKIAAGILAIGGGALVAGGTLLFGLGAAMSIFGPMGGAVAALSTRFMGLWSVLLKARLAVIGWAAATKAAGLSAIAASTPIAVLPGLIMAKVAAMKAWIATTAIAVQGAIVALPGIIAANAAAMKAWIITSSAATGGAILALPALLKAKALAFGQATIAALAWVKVNLLTIGGLKGLAMAGLAKIAGGLRLVAVGIRAIAMAAISNPIGIVVVLLATAALTIYRYWGPISGFFKGIWAGIKSGLFGISEEFSQAFHPLQALFPPIISGLKAVGKFLMGLISPVDSVAGAGESMGHRVGVALAGIIRVGVQVTAFFVGFVMQFTHWGTQMMTGLLNGITSGAAAVMNKVREIGASIKSAFTGMMGIKSPSRVFMDYGQMLGAGLELGMDAKASSIASAANRMAGAATPTMPAMPALSPVGLRAAAGTSSGSGMVVTFSPVIHISADPGQPAEAQIQQVMPDLYTQFVSLMRRYQHDQERVNP